MTVYWAVIRGSSYCDWPQNAPLFHRSKNRTKDRYEDLGLRVARTPAQRVAR